jgi:hypothetical protein
VFTFLKARGINVGASLVEDDQLHLATKLEALCVAKGVQLILASDCVVADRFAADASHKVVDVEGIPDGWMGLDIGPKTIVDIQAGTVAKSIHIHVQGHTLLSYIHTYIPIRSCIHMLTKHMHLTRMYTLTCLHPDCQVCRTARRCCGTVHWAFPSSPCSRMGRPASHRRSQTSPPLAASLS